MSNFAKFIKTTPITDDYDISNTVLGLGINGKVSSSQYLTFDLGERLSFVFTYYDVNV